MEELEALEALKAEARMWQRSPRPNSAKGFSIVQHLLVALEQAEHTIVQQAIELSHKGS